MTFIVFNLKNEAKLVLRNEDAKEDTIQIIPIKCTATTTKDVRSSGDKRVELVYSCSAVLDDLLHRIDSDMGNVFVSEPEIDISNKTLQKH